MLFGFLKREVWLHFPFQDLVFWYRYLLLWVTRPSYRKAKWHVFFNGWWLMMLIRHIGETLGLISRPKAAALREQLERCDEKVQELGRPKLHTTINAKGLHLQRFSYEVKKPRGAIIAMHGYASHFRFCFLTLPGQKYDGSWIQKLNFEGFSVYAYDHQGHGLSDAWQDVRCNCESFDDLVDDAAVVLNDVRTTVGGSVPVFMMALSMGGNVAAQAAAGAAGRMLDGIVLLSPMLDMTIMKAANRPFMPLLPIASRIAPHLAIGSRPVHIDEVHVEIVLDPLFYTGLSRARIGLEVMLAVDSAMSKASSIRCPVLLVHSHKDGIVAPDGSKTFLQKVSSEKADFVVADEMYHHLPNEKGNEKTYEHVLHFLLAHTPPRDTT
ncbi:unnamed protein product [Vitrella brassicaformis CCMP3155]|uniref:Serine aminopeptidase S33 domain-containing protein n=1 Tax=Vitrella brassicaformis (strain CCMP3155) TaxID=1169540 RepID=A0A0G4ECF4_VITBC|nr:unnamed protein product [Vitrella brassicaformis CCMP3155]|eukprot:CEL93626.1 unnamed protein product [Vitrella brassicaformis CCMP3155]